MNLPPLSIYVHIPWCVRKCPYCDFNSHQADPNEIPETEFLVQLRADLLQDAPLAQGRKVETLFFGGGTPSILSAEAIAEIISMIRENIGFIDDPEITLEANPGTFEAERFKGYLKGGVNRLSIGVQSFDDKQLKTLGRIHSADNAIAAISKAKEVGFDNFNIDLMHGLPDQTEADALADLKQAVALGPTHISWYQLTIEQNTEFYRHPPTIPEDEELWAIQQAGQDYLAEQGFAQYEVSAYCKAGKPSRHNLNYWRYGDYLGIGPGAHGKYTRIADNLDIVRTRKTRLPKDYLNNQRPLARIEEPVEVKDRAFDYFINTLRLKEDVSLTHFEAFTGVGRKQIESIVNQLQEQGWMKQNGDKLTTTQTGYLYLNEVLSYWLE